MAAATRTGRAPGTGIITRPATGLLRAVVTPTGMGAGGTAWRAPPKAPPARGRATAPGARPRRPRDRLPRSLHRVPRYDRAPRADQPDDHLVPVVPLAGARVGLRHLLALDGGVRLARPEGALLRPGGRAPAAAREGRHAERETGVSRAA